MRTFVRLLAFTTLVLAVCEHAGAQIFVPFPAKGGMNTALGKARDSLGSDAVLAFIGTFGAIDQGLLKVEFNPDNGRATLWGYTFFSPSGNRSMTIGVVQIPLLGYQTQELGGALPLPGNLDLALDTAGAYFNSDRMIAQLKKDSTFIRYRAELPDATPFLVTLGQLIRSDSAELPNGFPLDQPAWSLLFRGEGDSTMTCFVASRTGEHYCRRITLPTLAVPAGEAPHGTAALDIRPNPSNGNARIVVTIPHGMPANDASLRLYDERGAMVLDLSESLRANGYDFAQLEAGAIAAGVYYCRAEGDGWSGSAGLVVQR